jgi:Glycosyltransferase family 87
MSVPIRISKDRVVLYAAFCALIVAVPWLTPSWFYRLANHGDISDFWSAGSTVGTRTFGDPTAFAAWQTAHGIAQQVFVYLPGFAWLYAPLRVFSPLAAMIVNDLAMIALFLVAAVVAARVYGLPKWFALAATLGWAPTVDGIVAGQSTGFALLLTLAAVYGLVQRMTLITGVAVGLLLYKPTLALPMIVLLLARREWRSLGVVLAFAASWYIASVIATESWSWPVTYLHTLQWYGQYDLHRNAEQAFSLPSLLFIAGCAPALVYGSVIVVYAAAIAPMRSAPILEAASLAPLIGLAASLHAWPYDAVVALPAIFYATGVIGEPWRTRLFVLVYLGTVAISLIPGNPIRALAILCIGGSLAWLVWRLQNREARHGNPGTRVARVTHRS